MEALSRELQDLRLKKIELEKKNPALLEKRKIQDKARRDLYEAMKEHMPSTKAQVAK